MPAGSIAAHVESKLKAEARKKGYKGRRADAYVYGAMNNTGLKHGNKTTSKGMRDYSASRRRAKPVMKMAGGMA